MLSLRHTKKAEISSVVAEDISIEIRELYQVFDWFCIVKEVSIIEELSFFMLLTLTVDELFFDAYTIFCFVLHDKKNRVDMKIKMKMNLYIY